MAELHAIERPPLTDIPEMLRQRADAIEADPVKTAILITVNGAGDVATFGWGETDAIDTLATLQLAAFKLARVMVDG